MQRLVCSPQSSRLFGIFSHAKIDKLPKMMLHPPEIFLLEGIRGESRGTDRR